MHLHAFILRTSGRCRQVRAAGATLAHARMKPHLRKRGKYMHRYVPSGLV